MTYCGRSCIVGPDGEDLVRAGSAEGIFIADIDSTAIAASRRNNPILTDLRAELYSSPVRMWKVLL